MPYPYDKAKLDKWCADLQQSVDADGTVWDVYDLAITRTLMTYTNHLRKYPGYLEPEAAKVKAMLWTETGAGIPDWKRAPMQIGVNGDPGLRSLLDTVQGKMILPPIYQSQLTFSSVPVLPEQNIAAGIGYLLKLLANFNWVLDAPAVSIPVPGHKHHMAHPSRTKHLGITGWKLFDFLFTAKHYNVGDGNYRGKLEYAYNLIQQRVKAQKGR